jgi:hypothetical protein
VHMLLDARSQVCDMLARLLDTDAVPLGQHRSATLHAASNGGVDEAVALVAMRYNSHRWFVLFRRFMIAATRLTRVSDVSPETTTARARRADDGDL